jgi:hypothetical protein
MTLNDLDQTSIEHRFADQGYVHVPSLGLSAADLTSTRAILDGLFGRFSTLPRRFAHDLGAVRGATGEPVLPEILDVSTLAPALRQTPVYRAAFGLARRLLGRGTFLIYDHAIYKPPGQSGTTSWHQDSAYDPELTHALAIWIPFQDTGVVDGAMRYVPGSHLGGPRPFLTRTNHDGKTVKYLEVADADAVDAPCALGGATVHDQHTIHGAGPNLGADVRRALVLDFSTTSPPRRAVSAVKHLVRSRRAVRELAAG